MKLKKMLWWKKRLNLRTKLVKVKITKAKKYKIQIVKKYNKTHLIIYLWMLYRVFKYYLNILLNSLKIRIILMMKMMMRKWNRNSKFKNKLKVNLISKFYFKNLGKVFVEISVFFRNLLGWLLLKDKTLLSLF